MKKIETLIIAIVVSINAIAQKTPPFPSIDGAFAKVVMTTFESQIFKETGLHANQYKLLPKKEVKEWLDKYSEENSYFSAYPSTRCQELYWASKPNYPDDECHIMFSANSPKVGNEEYKSIVFEVVYSRLKNSVLTNTWEFKYFQYGGYYIFNKKAADGKYLVNNAVEALLQNKGISDKFENETIDNNGNKYKFSFNFNYMSSIDSIIYEKTDFKSSYNLNFYGTYNRYYFDTDCLPTSSGTYKLIVKASQEEEGGKVIGTHLRYSYFEELTTIKDAKEGFKTGNELTFSELYKKPKQPKCESK